MSLQSFIDGNLEKFLRQTNPDFAIVDSFPTTLANLAAHQFTCTDNGYQTLCIAAVKDNKVYYIMYRAQIPKYIKFLSIVEQMIASFDIIR